MEVPYDIPDSWEWVRLRNISSLSFFPNISGDKIPNYSWVLDMEDIEKETGRLVRKNYKTEKSSYKSNKVYFSKDTVLYAKLRPNLKKVIISDEDGFATTELIPIKIFGGISPEYMRYCMISPSYYFNIIKSVYGVKMPRVNATFLNSTLIPLPPLAEQKRIVAKIEELFSKINVYAESYNKLRELDKSFPDKLKKSILQYAMQGKLVPQDPNDEPVEVLLEKIQAEKQKLYKEGKLKKKDLAEIVVTKGDDNSPYGKILSWKTSTLNRVTNLYTGNSINATQKQLYFSSGVGINYIATKDVDFNGNITYDNGIKIPDTYLDGFKISQPQSILLCLEGGSAGRKIGMLDQIVCFGNKLCSLSFYSGNNKFLYYFLQSPQFLNDFKENKSGIIGGVSLKNLGNISIPLVPLTEQARISQRVEQLFEKVNQF
ncbi:restriction endonuclease subunit S [Streptococcus ruminantium]|uniref:restriction endonuclease subunit S n=1 Tax=Streptococcus ruminantium TaxID=1917441 RepID=UPI0012DE5A39|nr:restriction endonuclease subunit S [Streptococcus ruminantium]